jgi:ribosomal protein S18 acetylase RimI-like enzyme
VTIRPLGPADVEACAAIMSALPLWRQYGVSDREAREVFAAALHGAAHVQVADDGVGVVGFVEYLVRGTFGHSGYVWAIGVAADAQGRGIGGRLMDAAEAAIFDAGPNVFLLVSATNARARHFYERRGYRRTGELADYVRAGLTEIFYRKTQGPIRADGP